MNTLSFTMFKVLVPIYKSTNNKCNFNHINTLYSLQFQSHQHFVFFFFFSLNLGEVFVLGSFHTIFGFPGCSVVKNMPASARNAEETGSVPW